jgi:DNA-binding NarL/FixJ family response regulator
VDSTPERQCADVSAVKVLVADRDRSFAQALAFRLSQEDALNVIGSVYSGATTEAEVTRAHPDVVVLGETSGEEIVTLARRLASGSQAVQVVTLLSTEDARTACELVRAGACAVAVKDGQIEEVVRAVDGAGHDESYLPPRLLRSVLTQLRTGVGQSAESERFARLTPRERDVLAHMMAGLDRGKIAQRMVLSTNTVRTHIQNVFAKLGVHSTLEAVSVALRAGFSDRPRPPEPFSPGRTPRRTSRPEANVPRATR